MSDATVDGVSDNRVKRITSCIKDTCRLFEPIYYTVRKNCVMVCMSDGLGSSADLMAAFAAACNEESRIHAYYIFQYHGGFGMHEELSRCAIDERMETVMRKGRAPNCLDRKSRLDKTVKRRNARNLLKNNPNTV